MRDDGAPHGELNNKMKQIKQAHKQLLKRDITCLSLPLTSVVSYDLENYKMDLNQSFNIDSFLKESGFGQIKRKQDVVLEKFSSNLAGKARTMLEQENTTGTFDEFLG